MSWKLKIVFSMIKCRCPLCLNTASLFRIYKRSNVESKIVFIYIGIWFKSASAIRRSDIKGRATIPFF